MKAKKERLANRVSSNDLLCCPKCGGTTGVGGVIRIEKHKGTVGWTGDYNAWFDFDSIISESKTGKCLDCGKRVKVPTT